MMLQRELQLATATPRTISEDAYTRALATTSDTSMLATTRALATTRVMASESSIYH